MQQLLVERRNKAVKQTSSEYRDNFSPHSELVIYRRINQGLTLAYLRYQAALIAAAVDVAAALGWSAHVVLIDYKTQYLSLHFQLH